MASVFTLFVLDMWPKVRSVVGGDCHGPEVTSIAACGGWEGGDRKREERG